MKSFNERNPVTIAVVGLIAIALVCSGAFFWKRLPLINSATGYSANFTEAAGLKSGDDVRVAGVKIGSVSSVALQGTHVHVGFTVSGAWVGDQSTAEIKIATLLGQKFLAIDPLGGQALAPGSTIPLARTIAPFDVTTALEGLGTRLTTINTERLGRSFTSLANAFRHTPRAVRVSLHGLAALSRTIASRDHSLTLLLRNTRQLTDVIATDDPQIAALVRDGNVLLQELQARSSAITALLRGTQRLSTQLTGLVRDNSAALHPALTQLDRVTTILQNNQANLGDALRLLGPYYSLLTDALGNGRWLDTYICGLFTRQNVPQLNSTAQRNCAPQPPSGSSR